MFIPVIDTVLEMTHVDFEKYALQILESKTKGLDNVKFVHNKVVEAYDGDYQLDAFRLYVTSSQIKNRKKYIIY